MPAKKRASTSCIEVMQHIDDVIRHHEDTMHRDMQEQIREIRGALSSLSHDVNVSVASIKDDIHELKESTDTVVKATQAVKWSSAFMIGFGKVLLAIAAIGAAVVAAFKWGQKL